jgi:hypothetical protein
MAWRTSALQALPSHTRRNAFGFILMPAPIAGLSSLKADTLRTALAGVTSDMAVGPNAFEPSVGRYPPNPR